MNKIRRLADLTWEEFAASPAHIQDLHEAMQLIGNMRIYADPSAQEEDVEIVVAEVLEWIERARDRVK